MHSLFIDVNFVVFLNFAYHVSDIFRVIAVSQINVFHKEIRFCHLNHLVAKAEFTSLLVLVKRSYHLFKVFLNHLKSFYVTLMVKSLILLPGHIERLLAEMAFRNKRGQFTCSG